MSTLKKPLWTEFLLASMFLFFLIFDLNSEAKANNVWGGSCIGVVTKDYDGIYLRGKEKNRVITCQAEDKNMELEILASCRVEQRCEILGMFEIIGDSGNSRLIRTLFKVVPLSR